ncbi:MAG: molybdenum cofactor guanylyltransferase [Chthoniobacteraceae bacterium]
MAPSPDPALRFSAVLLAGGRSSRMGRDKAHLLWNGVPLWEHQLQTLRELEPTELLISTRAEQVYEAPGVRLIPDEAADLGPLSGVAAALQFMQTEWLVVLAVDLPEMSAQYLQPLLDQARQTGRGVVPFATDGMSHWPPSIRNRAPNWQCASFGRKIARSSAS